MSKAIAAAQTYIWQALNEHPKLVGRVYDGVAEEGVPYPYVVMGEFTSIADRTLERKGYEITATLHVWSDYPGNAEGLEYVGYVDELLEDTVPELPGDSEYYCFQSIKELQETIREGLLRHFPIRYRLSIQEKE